MKENFLKQRNIKIYIPFLYPWVPDLKDELSNEVNSVEAYCCKIWYDFPEWKSFEKKVIRVPNYEFLGDNIPYLSFYPDFFRNIPDLVVIAGTETTGSLMVALLSKLKRIPTIFIVEENMDVRRLYSFPLRFLGALKKIFINFIHRNVDILLPETDASKKYLASLGCNTENVPVAPHGLNLKIYKLHSPDFNYAKKIGLNKEQYNSKLKILYTGGYQKHKGIDVIIDLIKNAELKDDYIIFIPEYGENIEYYHSKLVKYNHVKLLPILSPSEMIKMLSIIDIVLVPSIVSENTERSPNIIIEAMASGKVVIASHIGGIPTMVGDAGFLFHEGDVDEIIHILKKILSDKKILDEIGEKALKHADSTLNIEVYSDIILQEYLQYIRSR